MKLGDIRNEYDYATLSKQDVLKNPIQQFSLWMNEALKADLPEPTAMTLSTANTNLEVSSRIVLLKDYDEEGFVFFTDYSSRKGLDLAANNKASLLFFWPELFRQIRIRGIVQNLGEDISDRYFYSRPLASQISAAVSCQSSEIVNRNVLEKKWAELSKFEKISRPDSWGGYCLTPFNIEFWQGRKSRLHDRIEYFKEIGFKDWKIRRLSP